MSKNDDRWEFLASWNPNQLTIEHNNNNACYQTVEQWLEDNADCDNPWCNVLDGEREKMIAAKSIWTLQVYPSTPIGFYAVAASTLEALIDWAMEQKDILDEVRRGNCKECRHTPAGKCAEHQ